MLAREITADLQAIRGALRPGQFQELTSKGIGFGTLARRADGSWDISQVTGLPRQSLIAPDPITPLVP